MSRVWAMPSKWTFQVHPIRQFVKSYMADGKNWIDPFAGEESWAEYRNDLNPQNENASSHIDANEFVALFAEAAIDGVIFDPPYSITQVSRSYKDIGLHFKSKENPTGGFPRVKDNIAKVLGLGGVCLSFGWNSVGMGKKRGFEIIEILLVCHGGNRNDTI